MFVTGTKETRIPVKIWLPKEAPPEESCLEQAYRLAQLPFIHKWVALMPDTHTGMGMPIGGVIASEQVVIPNAVGVDIGCGMGFVGTSLRADMLRGTETPNGSLAQNIVASILRNIPVGFNHHKTPQPSACLDRAKQELSLYAENAALLPELEDAYYQIGTLGGGNHFIELQEDDEGFVGIMLHSGSRHLGSEICTLFNKEAKALNEKWHSSVPPEYKLAFLPMDTEVGRQYLRWMNLALDFAYENRARMLADVKAIVERIVMHYTSETVTFGAEINCHHNYAAPEHHYGKNVLVHRKGATRAREGELGLIPGAMGSYSYVVRGKGDPESFCSSSHGAGRRYSRKGAMAAFSCEEVMTDLKAQNVVLAKHNKADVAEESRFAYKDIDEVMANQSDLVEPVKRLKTIGVVKG